MKKSTGVILILIILLLLGGIGVGGYFFIKGNNDSNKEIGDLKNEISDLKETIVSTSKNTNIADNNNTENSNTINTVEKRYEEITGNLPNENDSLFVTNVIKNNNDTYTLQGVIYSQYTLSEKDLNEIVKNGKILLDNKTYSIKNGQAAGTYVLCDENNNECYSIRKDRSSLNYNVIRMAQVSLTQKKTDNYKQITVSKDTKCVDLYMDSDIKTVEEQFKDYKPLTPPDSTHPTPSYTFEFKDGKCQTIFVDVGL